jgi:hypothetical protein
MIERKDVLQALRGQHRAIDALMATMIEHRVIDPCTGKEFTPSKCVLWPNMVFGNSIIERLEAGEEIESAEDE